MNKIEEDILLSKLSSDIKLNKAQLQLANKLLDLSASLEKYKLFFWQRQFKGMYIWGKAGRGKTMLMDLFYANATVNKKRVHWHSFLKSTHHEQSKYIKFQDEKPKKNQKYNNFSYWLDGVKLLCFDEFHIPDAGNAAILRLFIEQAIKNKITLLLTSNYHPTELLTDSFQRHLIQKTRSMIEDKFEVIQLEGKLDYRTVKNKKLSNDKNKFFVQTKKINIRNIFSSWNDSPVDFTQKEIQIDGRHIKLEAKSKNGVWFEYTELCEKNRSYFDYLSYASKWQIFAISNLPEVSCFTKDSLRRFIWLVDILYEAKTRLLLQLPVNKSLWLKELNKNSSLDIKRCVSRLQEMGQ